MEGNPLHFTVQIDTSKWKKNIEDIEADLQRISKSSGKETEAVDGMMDVLKKELEAQKAIITELEKKYQDFYNLVSKMPSGAAKTDLGQEGAAIAAQLEAEKQKLKEAEENAAAYRQEYERLRAELKAATEQMQQLAAAKDEEKQQFAQLESRADAYEKKIQDLTAQLQEQGRVGTDAGKAQVASIDDSAQAMQNYTDITKENILIQKQVIKDLEAEYKALQKELDKMAPGNAKDARQGEANNLKAQIDAEKAALIDLQTALQSNSAAHDTLRTKLLAVRNEMAQLVANGQKNSAQYNELAAKAAEYQRAINAVNAEMKAINRNAGLDVIVGGMQAATGAASTFMGVMTLLSDKNENLTKIMTNLQGVMAAAIGVQQLQNTMNREGALIQGIQALQANAKAKAEAIGTATTIRATIAQKAFNAVAKANPYVLLAAAIISVVGAIALMSKKSQQAAEDMKAMNKQVADSVAEPMIQYKMLQAQWNALGNDLKAKEKFIKDNKDEFNKLGVEVNNVNDAENVLRGNTTAMEDSMRARAKAAAAMQLAAQKYKEYLENFDEHQQREQKYANDGLFGKINKSVNEFGANILGIGPKSTAQMDAMKNGYESMVKVAVKSTQEADKAFAKAGFRAPGTTKTNKPKNKPRGVKPEEFLPPGSVAEIQKRLSEIDKALSKATGAEQIAALKAKRLAAVKELAAAEAKIRIDSLKETFDKEQSLWADYYAAVESLGKDKADEIYKGLLPDGSLFERLKQMQQELISGEQTDESRTLLGVVNKQIDEMLGKESALDRFKKAIAEINNIEDLQTIRGGLSDDDVSNGYAAIVAERNREIIQRQRERFEELLKEQRTYEEKSLALQKEFEDMKASAQYQAASDADRVKIDKSFSDQQGVLDIDMIKKSKEWEVAFGELEGMTNTSLQAVLNRLLEFKEKSKGTLSLQDSAELEKAIEKVRQAANRNPFAGLTQAGQEYFQTQETLTAAQKDYNAAVQQFGVNSTQAIAAQNRMIDADQKALVAKQKLIGLIGKGQEIFNAVGQGLRDLGDAFGGFDDATTDAINNIEAIGNAAMDLGKALLNPSDIGGMIKAGIQLISSVWKAINGDQKKERQIKKQAAQLKLLERAYNDLAYAAEKAFGAQKYKGQQDMIKNLEQQRAMLQSLASTEGEKKRADQGKIDEYNAQIQSINQSIENIKESIIKDVLQTDIPDMAAKIGDALLDAFAKGEDGIDAINGAFDNMVRNIMRNQLNKILEKDLSKVVDNMRAAMGFNADGTGTFNGLTPEEIADLRAQVQAATSQGQAFIDAYSSIFEDLGNPTEGLKGDIKGMTEKTAGALEGQINAMRINQIVSQDIMRNSLLQLTQIEINTRNLVSIRQDISEMNGKMQKGLAGIP